MTARTPRLNLPLLAATLLLVAGCGNLTAGGFGEVSTEVVGDGGNGPESSVAYVAPASFMPGGQGGGAFQGEVTVELRVLLRSDAGDWVELTDGIERVEVSASGSTVAEVARTSLQGGSYDRVRVEFSRAEVFVTSAPPGLGIPGDGNVVVDFGGSPLVLVERPISLLLDESGSRLRIDLRAGAWIRGAVLGRVPAATFRSAVRVSVVGPGGGD